MGRVVSVVVSVKDADAIEITHIGKVEGVHLNRIDCYSGAKVSLSHDNVLSLAHEVVGHR
jgi:hypothetical protein